MLRIERQAKGLSAQELSLRLQMHPTYVSRVERGYRSIDVIELLDLLQAMGAETKGFLDRFVDQTRQK
jgi:transcriptional regulator with XRE-family HTH domain